MHLSGLQCTTTSNTVGLYTFFKSFTYSIYIIRYLLNCRKQKRSEVYDIMSLCVLFDKSTAMSRNPMLQPCGAKQSHPSWPMWMLRLSTNVPLIFPTLDVYFLTAIPYQVKPASSFTCSWRTRWASWLLPHLHQRAQSTQSQLFCVSMCLPFVTSLSTQSGQSLELCEESGFDNLWLLHFHINKHSKPL